MQNSDPLNIRSECIAVPEIPAPITAPEIKTDFDWDKISESQRELFSSLLGYKEYLRHQHRRIEQEICDIQHYIEFVSLDAARGYKAYRMLHDRLQRRRHIMNKLAKVSHILSASPEALSSGDVERKIYSVDHAGYTPRVLNELFGKQESKRGNFHPKHFYAQ